MRSACFASLELPFLETWFDSNGILPDPEKTKAIHELPAPTSPSQLRRFMGMINQLNKFSPQIAEVSKLLWELLSPKQVFVWTHVRVEAFAKVKQEAAALALEKEAKMSADASAYGHGAALLQKHGSDWRPVAFASRALTETESRYAQIEKEALVLTWSCEEFSSYILGKPVQLETDHKPLMPILGHKSLDSFPSRVLHFRLRLFHFHLPWQKFVSWRHSFESTDQERRSYRISSNWDRGICEISRPIPTDLRWTTWSMS